MQGQAELYRLYSPQRLKKPAVPQDGAMTTGPAWDAALQQVADELKKAAAAGKTNVYLAGKTTGTLGGLIDHFGESAGVERVKEYEPFSHTAIRKANGLLFGDAAVPEYKIAEA